MEWLLRARSRFECDKLGVLDSFVKLQLECLDDQPDFLLSNHSEICELLKDIRQCFIDEEFLHARSYYLDIFNRSHNPSISAFEIANIDHFKLNKYESSLSLYEMAARNKPTKYDFKTHLYWGMAFEKLNQFDEAIPRFKMAIYLFDKLDEKLFLNSDSCPNFNDYFTPKQLKSQIENAKKFIDLVQLQKIKILCTNGCYNKRLNLLKLSVYNGDINAVLESYGIVSTSDDNINPNHKCPRGIAGSHSCHSKKLASMFQDAFCDHFAVLGKCESCDEKNFHRFPSALRVCEHAVSIEYYISTGNFQRAMDYIDYLLCKHANSSHYGSCCKRLVSQLYNWKATILCNILDPKIITKSDENQIEKLYLKSIKICAENHSAYHCYSLFWIKYRKNLEKAQFYHEKAYTPILKPTLNVDQQRQRWVKEEQEGLNKYSGRFHFEFGESLFEWLESARIQYDSVLESMTTIEHCNIIARMQQSLSAARVHNPNIPECAQLHATAFAKYSSKLECMKLDNSNRDVVDDFSNYAKFLSQVGCRSYYYYSFGDCIDASMLTFEYVASSDAYFMYSDQAIRHFGNKVMLRLRSFKDLSQNRDLMQKYGFSSFGECFCLTSLLDPYLWLVLTAIIAKNSPDYDYHATKIIRNIRTSLMLYSHSWVFEYDNNITITDANARKSTLDKLYFQHMSRIALGILSFHMIDVQKQFTLTNYSLYRFRKLKQYLKRFVIDNIESSCLSIMKMNRNMAKTDVIRSAHYCLFVSYWVMGDKIKIRQYYDHFLEPMFVDGDSEYWHNATQYMKPDEHIKPHEYRFLSFIKCVARCQEFARNEIKLDNYDNESEFMPKITNKIELLVHYVINEATRNDLFHPKWRNLVNNRFIKQCNYCRIEWHEKRLKKCMRCKSVYYCSKKCQKRDWVATHAVHCHTIPQS